MLGKGCRVENAGGMLRTLFKIRSFHTAAIRLADYRMQSARQPTCWIESSLLRCVVWRLMKVQVEVLTNCKWKTQRNTGDSIWKINNAMDGYKLRIRMRQRKIATRLYRNASNGAPIARFVNTRQASNSTRDPPLRIIWSSVVFRSTLSSGILSVYAIQLNHQLVTGSRLAGDKEHTQAASR